MSTFDVLKKEFQLKNFWLSFPHQEPFYNSQWKCPQWLFIIYRFVMAAYAFGALLHYFIGFTNAPHNPMIYLTTWSYLILNFHFIVSLLVVIWMVIKKNVKSPQWKQKSVHIEPVSMRNITAANSSTINDSSQKSENINGNDSDNGILSSTVKPLPWYFNYSWFLANVISIWALIVTIIYYASIFKGTFTASDVNVHMMNTVVILIDTMFSATPVKLLHVIYPIIYGLAYVICNAIYWSVDPENNVIYAVVMDWSTPVYPVSLLFVLMIVVIPLLQGMFFGIYRLKLFIFKKIFNEEYQYQAW